MSKIIKCECCGVEFEAKRYDAKYCSKSCSNKKRHKDNFIETKPLIKKCKHCNIKFETKRSNTEHCSKKCITEKWNEANKERKLALLAEWRERNKDKQKANFKAWYQGNRENSIAAVAKWGKENPEKVKFYSRKSSLRKLGYPEELLEIKELQYQIKKEIKNQLKGDSNVNN